jgi:gliding motility-associated-like protein
MIFKPATIKRNRNLKGYVLPVLFMMAGFICKGQILDTLCVNTGKQVYHVAPTPGSTYQWFIDCGVMETPEGLDSVVVSWCPTPGIHQVKVVETNSKGCVGDTVMAFILLQQNIGIDGPADICRGETIQLTASTGAQTYIWSTGAHTPSIIVTPVKDTTYYLVCKGNLCLARDTVFWKVKVHDLPTAAFSFSPQQPHLDEDISFNFTGNNASDLTWTFNDSTSKQQSKELNPEFTFHSPGTRRVTLVVRNGAGCIDTMSYTFYMKREAYIFVPNAFTPNDNNKNEIFKPTGYGIRVYDMEIYNRWGEKLFETTDMDHGWDGYFKGQPVEEGVYVYKINAQGVDGQWHFLKGNLTLLR